MKHGVEFSQGLDRLVDGIGAVDKLPNLVRLWLFKIDLRNV